ncbi:MAG: type II toxin-antitoxin system HicA family toxin [Candidatus Ryanbacteria bacterium]|nr:type II toxin-antitoxin system HicA family toxin [Candidatus Ryanbacteria bacterium]
MPKPKPVGYDEFARKLKRAGYIPIRKSRHTVYFHPTKQITIPLPHKHPHDIPKGLLHKLSKEMKIPFEEFNRL